MLHKRIIRGTTHESSEFLSPIFIAKKAHGGAQLFLNLKKLNEFIKYEHIKMNRNKTIINIGTKNCFMAAINL